ncbi:MAG: AgmX/PglI C-terminal domain-containing protein [Bdellovibrionaceae bacterium]|nr:AgmX/PglI C-terminal domain-containing protein [Pseudobdellovibrionaceae bacterium]
MRRVEVDVEHYYKKRFMGRKRLIPTDKTTIIGQTKDCGLRLLGDGVSNLHAAIDYSDDLWTISDLGSEQGTWVKKKPIVSQVILGPVFVHIGQHELKIYPKTIESHLFAQDEMSTTKNEAKIQIDNMGSARTFHQIIIKKNSFVVSSKLLPQHVVYTYIHGKEKKVLNPPKSKNWSISTFGDVVIQQRLISSQVIEETQIEKMSSIWDPNLKGPLVVTALLILLLTTIFVFYPTVPDSKLEELKPDQQNRYTRMIYDAKAIRQKRKESRKIQKSIAKQNSNIAAPAQSKNLQVAKSNKISANSQVITKIKTAGLSQLIGKISNRAAKNANFINAVGVSANNKNSGRSLATVGDAAPNALSKTGSSFKLGSVKTDGKAGGSNSYKKVGGLALGNVGTASVGILEEETDIEGGLDKDVIARVIEQNLGQIRYCYERQLSANPELYGKVLVKFTISGSGAVAAQAIGLTTLKSAMVEGCILRRVSGWQFPQPKGGTQVRVTYPFLFKSTN